MEFFLRIFLLWIVLCIPLYSGADNKSKIWVFFIDKPGRAGVSYLSKQTVQRRIEVGARVDTYKDIPVAPEYIRAVEETGAELRHVFKWGNAASFELRGDNAEKIKDLPFVSEIRPVGVYRRISPESEEQGLHKRSADTLLYGNTYTQQEMVSVVQAHGRILSDSGDVPGSGVRVALFDDGFWLDHPAFTWMNDSMTLVGDSDFVDNDSNALTYSGTHGSKCASLICGYNPPDFTGVAWGAEFLFARTEDNQSETHVEEDNWAAAVVWAESMGADVVSSSLGYRNFDEGEEGYTYEDMDGRSTIVAQAAVQALEFGMGVVNSAGNRGERPGSIDSPTDVDGVIGVGGVTAGGKITDFSSRGPTYDGRIKPDLVALGTSVYLPESNGYSFYNSGTSYSCPQVAGIYALTLQYNRGEDIRERIYASCSLTEYQDSVDNTYGRGIPDAYTACFGKMQYFRYIDNSGDIIDASGVLTVNTEEGQIVREVRDGRAEALILPESEYTLSSEFSDDDPINSGPYYADQRDTVYVKTAGHIFSSEPDVFPNPASIRGDSLEIMPGLFPGSGYSCSIVVYTREGRPVFRETVEVGTAAEERSRAVWDLTNPEGEGVVPGTYLLCLNSEEYGMWKGKVMVLP